MSPAWRGARSRRWGWALNIEEGPKVKGQAAIKVHVQPIVQDLLPVVVFKAVGSWGVGQGSEPALISKPEGD